MSYQEFLRPRLTGSRFEQHTLPLDILKDFAALEEMLVEVARYQYLTANPMRRRLPKGFPRGLGLHLTMVQEGSAIAVIAMVFSSLFPSADADIVEQAKNQIIDAIAAVGQGRQPGLPPELLRCFDRFGRGLREGEAMEFTSRDGRTAELTPATREALLRASQAEQWTEETTLKGRIPEADQADHCFELELGDGTKLKAPLLDQHRDTVLGAFNGYRNRMQVAIKGVIQRDRENRPRKFEVVEHVTPLDPLDIETRLEGLARLDDGWLDGKGFAPNRDALARLARRFDEHYAPDLPLPYLYPTAEGGVQAEWSLGRWEMTLEITLPSLHAQFQALHLETGESRDFDLALDGEGCAGWTALNDTLRDLQETPV